MYKCAPSRELPRTCCAVEDTQRNGRRGGKSGGAEQDGERGTAPGKRNRTENEARRAVRSQAETSTELPQGAQEARTRRRNRKYKKDSGRSCRPLCLVRSCVPLSRCCALFGVAFRAPAFPAAPPIPLCIRFSECATGAGKLSAGFPLLLSYLSYIKF